MTYHISQFEIVPVTEANRRLTADGMNYPYQRWIRPSDGEDRKTGYILYYSAGCHDGHWYRTKTQAKMKRQELIQERLRKDMSKIQMMKDYAGYEELGERIEAMYD